MPNDEGKCYVAWCVHTGDHAHHSTHDKDKKLTCVGCHETTGELDDPPFCCPDCREEHADENITSLRAELAGAKQTIAAFQQDKERYLKVQYTVDRKQQKLKQQVKDLQRANDELRTKRKLVLKLARDADEAVARAEHAEAKVERVKQERCVYTSSLEDQLGESRTELVRQRHLLSYSERLREHAEAKIEAMRAALAYHVEAEDGPCRLDHHGYCQEHGSFEEGECMIRQHRRLLGLETNNA